MAYVEQHSMLIMVITVFTACSMMPMLLAGMFAGGILKKLTMALAANWTDNVMASQQTKQTSMQRGV